MSAPCRTHSNPAISAKPAIPSADRALGLARGGAEMHDVGRRARPGCEGSPVRPIKKANSISAKLPGWRTEIPYRRQSDFEPRVAHSDAIFGRFADFRSLPSLDPASSVFFPTSRTFAPPRAKPRARSALGMAGLAENRRVRTRPAGRGHRRGGTLRMLHPEKLLEKPARGNKSEPPIGHPPRTHLSHPHRPGAAHGRLGISAATGLCV